MKSTICFILFVLLFVISCGKKERWAKEIDQPKIPVEIIDISKGYYNPQNQIVQLKSNYPFFFDDSVEDSVFDNRRKSDFELNLFDSIQVIYANQPYKSELEDLFTRYKFYFPTIKTPEVFVYSSALQSIYQPVIYSASDAMMFIALDGFLGSNSSYYKAENVYLYLVQNMNERNIIPSIVQAIGNEIIPFDPRKQAFVDLMINEGKKMILADALLPNTEDYLKIGYSPEKFNWAGSNEGNIWNYFVEQNLVFSTDKSLSERFLKVGPYSKFMNEIESDSPGRIGLWIGWQICKSYLDLNSEITLAEFINTDTETIFKGSKYKPSKGSGQYVPLENNSKDEIKQYEN